MAAAAAALPSSSASASVEDFTTRKDLLAFEEDLLRVGPYSLKTWWRYLEHVRESSSPSSSFSLVSVTFERSLKHLPGSYKLWHAYLAYLVGHARQFPPGHQTRKKVLATFERALVHMGAYPVIWARFLEFLTESSPSLTLARRAFDRALRSLPVTQHDRIWPLYLKFASSEFTPTETALRVYKRYLKVEPGHREEYVAYCKSRGLHNEAARALQSMLDDRKFVSLLGRSRHQIWLDLIDLVTTRPNEITTRTFDPPALLRGGIAKNAEMSGRLHCALADYYIRKGMFACARDAYVDGIESVQTVRDFSLVFDAYAQYLEQMISSLMEEGEGEAEGEGDQMASNLDLLLSVLEDLVATRPLLLNACHLRQDPNSVKEWLRRVDLVKEKKNGSRLAVEVFAQATKTCDSRALRYGDLWTHFAKFYEDNDLLDDAREVYERAVGLRYRSAEDLAGIWCSWAEMEIRARENRKALEVARAAVAKDSSCRRSLRCWMLLGDLTESLGTLDEVKAVYGDMIDLKVATPQVILNFASLLEERRFFEEAFKVYERGVSLFRFPHSKPIWQAYLAKFVARYKGKKVERARELFRSALGAAASAEGTAEEEASAGNLQALYTQYASFEEMHGLAKNVMAIYEEALAKCPAKDKLPVLTSWVSKAKAFYGVAKMRQIYQTAIETPPPGGLRDEDCRAVCLRYAKLERSLGEVDRARAILRHGSGFANPRDAKSNYWSEWNKFEVAHGNEDTFREMLRIKRSVSAFYSQANQYSAVVAGADDASKQANAAAGLDQMAALEAAAERDDAGAAKIPGFVKAETINVGKSGAGEDDQADGEDNPEDIDIDLDMEDDGNQQVDQEKEGNKFALKQKAVPQDVFGSLGGKRKEGPQEEEEKKPKFMGAAERFKRAKTNQHNS